MAKLICQRLPSKVVHIDHIPSGTPIVDCGRSFIARLKGGDAVVHWTSQQIIATSRLRRAVIRGSFAGTPKRKRRRR